MQAKVNGQAAELAERSTVADVLAERGMDRDGVAVALDGQLVRRSEWADTTVPDGAALEIITAVQGG